MLNKLNDSAQAKPPVSVCPMWRVTTSQYPGLNPKGNTGIFYGKHNKDIRYKRFI